MFVFQAEDGIRDLVRSRGLGDVYKRQILFHVTESSNIVSANKNAVSESRKNSSSIDEPLICLLYTSDAADERSSVDLGGRRIIKKKTSVGHSESKLSYINTS